MTDTINIPNLLKSKIVRCEFRTETSGNIEGYNPNPTWFQTMIDAGANMDKICQESFYMKSPEHCELPWCSYEGYPCFVEGKAYFIDIDFEGYLEIEIPGTAIHSTEELIKAMKPINALYELAFTQGRKAGRNEKAAQIQLALAHEV